MPDFFSFVSNFCWQVQTMAWKTAGIRFPCHSYESCNCKSPVADWTRKWDDRYFTSPFLIEVVGFRLMGSGGRRIHNDIAPRMLSWRFARIVIPSVAEESFSFAANELVWRHRKMGNTVSRWNWNTVLHANGLAELLMIRLQQRFLDFARNDGAREPLVISHLRLLIPSY